MSSDIQRQIDSYKNNSLKEESTKPRSSKPNKLVRFLSSKPKWMLYLIGGSLGTVSLFFFITTIVLATYNPTKSPLTLFAPNTTVGQKCSTSSQCVQDAYCSIASGQSYGTCQCIASYFLSFTSARCDPKKAYWSSCTATYECFDNKLQTCISSICQCDTSVLFWNSTALECQYKKAPIAICSSSSECPAFTSCTNPWPLNNNPYYSTKCLCSGSYWFNTDKGACEPRKAPGSTCSVDWECINYAYCEKATGSCVCDSAYYYSGGACNIKTITTNSNPSWIGCSLIDQCNWMQHNLRCFSSRCNCDLNLEYWDTLVYYCSPKKRYGQTCIATSDCIETTIFGLQCLSTTIASGTRKACLCPSTQYFDVVTGICSTKKVYNSQCDKRSECADAEAMVCVTQGSGVTKRCTCAPNYAYYNSTSGTCILRKAFGDTCTSSSECPNLNGMGCFSNVCNCDPMLKYYLTTLSVCAPLKRKSDYCTANSECASGTCSSNLCT